MRIGALEANDLAERFGTPLLAVDVDAFDHRLDALLDACDRAGVGASYAAKALMTVPLARHLGGRAIGIDVCSLGELATLERAAFPTSRITLHGAGKTADERAAALDGGVGRIVVDNLDELRALCATKGRTQLDTLLRLNLGIEAHTHDFVRTAGDNSKFGLAPHEVEPALALLHDAAHLRLRGLHSHIGSQIYDAAPFAENVRLLLLALTRVRERGFDADTIVAGGGFGVPMDPARGDERLDVTATVATIGASVPAGVHAEIEPGRFLIAAAGTTLYRVVAIKRYDRRTFAVVDGSMADNPRPALYGAYHHVTCVRASGAPAIATTVCGRSCENDELGEAMLPEDLRAGDVLAFASTGAYTYSMASNYNRFARPPIVAVRGSDAALWTRRETVDDLLRLDAI